MDLSSAEQIVKYGQWIIVIISLLGVYLVSSTKPKSRLSGYIVTALDASVKLLDVIEMHKNLQKIESDFLNFKSENDQNIFQSKYNFLKDYKLKYRFKNCYLMELK